MKGNYKKKTTSCVQKVGLCGVWIWWKNLANEFSVSIEAYFRFIFDKADDKQHLDFGNWISKEQIKN